MTDWTVQSVIFRLKTALKLPEIEQNCQMQGVAEDNEKFS